MRRPVILLAILVGLLCLTALWSYRYVAEQSRAGLKARRDLSECRRYAAAIERLKERPDVATGHVRLHAETTTAIEDAAKSARLSARSLARITPEPPRRVADTVYREKPTQVLVKNVTLEQLVQMVHGLVGAGHRLHARSIRITAPKAEDTGRQWNAELLLTYLIYDPPVLKR